MSDTPLLSVEGLTTHFHTDEGTVYAVNDVSFEVEAGETVAIVGESGSGKSVMSESITKIIDMPPGEIVSGSVEFDGMELTDKSDKELQSIRGDRISHVFQNPQNGLNPVLTVGSQVGETLKIHRDDISEDAIRERTIDLLDRAGIPEATTRMNDYPHEFSGGMKQRVLIAMALAADPDLLIADEPTTALDVTLQAQILQLLEELKDDYGMSMIFITHDLAVVSEIADRVVIMYAGKIMEKGRIEEVFQNPSHPYTKALIECLPGRGDSMNRIPGSLPPVTAPPDGCRFHPRCEHAEPECKTGEHPPMYDVDGTGHVASCVYYDPENRTGNRDVPIADDGADARADGGSDE